MFARRFVAPSVVAAMFMAAADLASAQARYPNDYRVNRTYDIAYNNGYREGLDEGQKDGRQRDRYAYIDENDFRRADKGYRREYGDRDHYRRVFRDGFIQGYSEGFDSVRRGRYGSGAAGRSRVDRRHGVAYDHGYSDGYEKGLEDARDRDRYDPVRHGVYRSADHGYDNRYGTREQYRNEFRSGFMAGYETGYRDGDRYGRSGARSRTTNRPWWLPF